MNLGSDTERDALFFRFINKIELDKKTGCWLWTGALSLGYGIMSSQRGRSPYKAYRVSFQLFNGDIPKGKIVRHTCDNPPCVNPVHLISGTQKDNIQDASRRGRLNPKSLLNLRPGAIGFHGAGPKSNKEIE